MSIVNRTVLGLVAALSIVTIVTADGAWKWSGPRNDKAVSLLIIGDIDIQRRADPTTAFVHLRDTLNAADVVYANLEGVLVKPRGPEIDIPDKRGWRHPGPEGVVALKSANVKVVGVANNVAYDRANIVATVKLLDANGIAHTGGGANIEAAHEPAIVERKGVKIGFLQYTARWYQDDEQLYGHGTHTVQGVEVYKGKPILYAVGHSAFDQPGYENSKDGLVVRAVIDGKKIRRVSFVPVTRDEKNDVLMLDPASGEGAKLVEVIKGQSGDTPLRIDGQEVVLIAPASRTSHN